LEFEVGEKVYLKVSPMKGVSRFGKKSELNPHYIRPLEILKCIVPMAYRLALPPNLTGINNVFHVSMLQKYVQDLLHVLESEPLPRCD
jgi:hypothetical protein